MRDHSDALCQLEPSDAHEAMSRGLFCGALQVNRFIKVFGMIVHSGPQYKRVLAINKTRGLRLLT